MDRFDCLVNEPTRAFERSDRSIDRLTNHTPPHSIYPKKRHDALIQELLAAEDLPTLAFERADAFDYHFMAHLMGRLQASNDQGVRVCVGGWVC